MGTWEQLERYRQMRTLPDGSRVLLRPLTVDDREGLVNLFARASKEDLEFFRDDAADVAVVGSWVDNLNLRRVFPLVAVTDDQIVGDATLHFRERYHRHLAWVRIFLDRGTNDVIDTAIVAEMDDFDTLCLNQPPHDIDRCIVAIKQGCGRNEPQRDFFGVSRNAGKIAGNRTHRLESPGKEQQKASTMRQKLK